MISLKNDEYINYVIYNFLNIILMMQSFLSCFACGQKNQNTVVAPEPVSVSQVKVTSQNQNDIKTDDNKSRISMTTVTFLSSQTRNTKQENDDQQINRKIQQLLKIKQLPQRKARESQFVKNNLIRSNVIYLIDKKWSEEYTKFLKNHKFNSIGPIDNSKLMDSKNQLKSNLKQKQDYFIVTQKIWKFVYGLYGGGPTISRDYTFPVYNIVSRRSPLAPIGITNPLNLCYMISVVQMLLSIQQLNGYMLKKMYTENSGSQIKKKIFHNLYFKLIKQYSQVQGPPDSKIMQIKQFASFFQTKFSSTQQHDAHQFLLYFCQQLQQQMKLQVNIAKPANNPESKYSYYFKQNKSMIDKIFAGQQQTIVTCSSCENKSTTYVPFIEIVLSIMGFDTVEECLDKYFQSIKLDDLYECQTCKKKTKAAKSTCITKTPNFLILVLGKFSCTTQKKIQHRVKYSVDLDLKRHCFGHCGDTTYLLQSLVIHKGSKSTKGHYYTFTRRGKQNNWFLLNDASVRQIEENEVLDRDAYILVYQRFRG